MEGYTLLQTLLVIRLSSGALVAHETVVDTEAFPVGIYLVRSCGVIPAKKTLRVWVALKDGFCKDKKAVLVARTAFLSCPSRGDTRG